MLLFLLESYPLFFTWWCVLLGVVIGSFLNVVIYRLHTGRSLTGQSHCLSCGKGLQWYELFPVLSYVLLRGRCRGCRSYIPWRYVAVEILTGGLFGWVFVSGIWLVGVLPLVQLLLLFILTALLVVVFVYDLRHTIIPDELVAGLLAVAVPLVALRGDAYQDAFVGALVAGGFVAALWLISGGRWIGLGDAKLLLPLGALVGITSVYSLVVLSFWIGMVVSLGLISYTWWRGKHRLRSGVIPRTIQSEIPFAPFIIISFWLVYVADVNVFAMVSALIEYFV